jgi:hypothetical protein
MQIVIVMHSQTLRSFVPISYRFPSWNAGLPEKSAARGLVGRPVGSGIHSDVCAADRGDRIARDGRAHRIPVVLFVVVVRPREWSPRWP